MQNNLPVGVNLQLLKAAIENTNVGFSIGDARLPHVPLIYVNPVFETMTGYTSEEVLGKSCNFLQADNRDQSAVDKIRNALRDGTSCTVVLQNYRKDGSMFWNQLHLNPLYDDDGNITHFIGTQTNITALREIEDNLLKSEVRRIELENEHELIAMKENFISVVTHEFRTPLTVIVSSIDILDRYQDRITSEKKQEHFEKIRAQTNYMRLLLDDVLTFSKGAAGKIKFSPQLLNLETLCSNLLEQIKIIDDRGHLYILEMQGSLDAVPIDEILLQHILVNLLTNAAKYSPMGSEIRFNVAGTGDHVIFTIQDHGIGIPKKDQPYLFEPFHRASNASKIKGTGLGLAIVKDNVQLHGGIITFSSEPDIGTTFTVTLPLSV